MPGLEGLDISFPERDDNMRTEDKLLQIYDYLFQLLETLRYTLANLGVKNFNDKELDDLTKPIFKSISDTEGNLLQVKAMAEGAQVTASNAQGSATKAQITADGAQVAASNAQGDATKAQITADGAQMTASNAEGAVQSLSFTVDGLTVAGDGKTTIDGSKVTSKSKDGRSQMGLSSGNISFSYDGREQVSMGTDGQRMGIYSSNGCIIDVDTLQGGNVLINARKDGYGSGGRIELNGEVLVNGIPIGKAVFS